MAPGVAAPAPKDECIKVVVRVRPLNSKEKADKRKPIVIMDMRSATCHLTNPKEDEAEPPKSFTFDNVFDETVTQMQVRTRAGKCMCPVPQCAASTDWSCWPTGQPGEWQRAVHS